MERKNKKNYYLDIAEATISRSTCLRGHHREKRRNHLYRL